MNTRQMFQVSPSIAKKEDKSDSMNASKRLTAALAGLVSGKARRRQVARGKTSPPRTCQRFVQATHGWFSATGRMFLFVCLTALAVSLFPERAYGQRLLVGNINQGAGFGTSNIQDHAQAFTTGSNSTGYKLTSVEMNLITLFNSTASYNVSIYTNNSGAPGTSIGSLTKPATFTGGLNEFTTTGNGIDLDPSTTYFLVVDLNSSTGNSWRGALVGTEDPGSANGWTIADKHLYRARNSTGAWTEDNVGPLRVRIKGYIKLRNPPTLQISSATAPENADFLQFIISLSHKVEWYGIRLDFETLTTGTATPGVDFETADLTLNIKPNTRSHEVGVGLIEDSVNDNNETVKVQISNAYLVGEGGHLFQSLTITTAQGEGRINAPTTTTTNLSNVNLRINNTRGSERGGWLRFTVTLSRPLDEYVCYDFETLTTGSATPGTDYLAQPKVDFWMDKGEVRQRPFVRLKDDSVDDRNETVIVQISNARLCDDPSRTINIARSQATGTITNSDPIPQAFLGRLGRTAVVQVVEQVEERLQAPRESGLQARLAGQELRRGMERDVAVGMLNQLGNLAHSHAPMTDETGPATRAVGDPDWRNFLRTGIGMGDLLTGSALEVNQPMRRGGILSFWSNGSRSHFGGRDGTLSVNGSARAMMFGFDYARGPLMTGLTLAHNRGQGRYADMDNGQLASSMTGLYPWLGYKATDRITIWGVAGYGAGGLLLTPQSGPVLESNLSMVMAAGGTRGELIAKGAGGFGMAFKADALWVETSVDGVDEGAGRLAATEAVATRFRTAIEGSRSYNFAVGVSLTPTVEIGLRHDGGDAEIGGGMDIAGGLVLSSPSNGVMVDVRARTLLIHQAEGFQDKGVAISFSYNPRPSTPLGFIARVVPSWGGQAESGADMLWGRETMEQFRVSDRHTSERRLKADLGYGLLVGRHFVGTPRIGFGTSEYGRDYRAGYGLTLLNRERPHFELGVDVQRRESTLLHGTDHGVFGRSTMRW